ncbi:MAG TPA: MmcQ/YjbR family DNA-binding protein [Stellaceae bacterium]|jgi:predicted DNA-binding protein (MmcQ/YjbR family)|nr:MmcQ/YjbR family DNA-binding protein [Stellaceae bacterium]
MSRVASKNTALDKFCRSLPAVTMSVQWGDHRLYKVGGKMFAVLSDRGTVSFKANDVACEMLVEMGQARPSPYRTQWLHVDDIKQFPPAELRQYIAASHALVAKKLTKKAQRDLGLAG